ncbi:MAG: hypothetical protein KAT43_04720 [Nanoarchaeota archaeon]|nr:hypothetical protein [Nanoarchaeota archaeon]
MQTGKIQTQQEEEFCAALVEARKYQEKKEPGRLPHYWEALVEEFNILWTRGEPNIDNVLAELEETYYNLEPELQTRYYHDYLQNVGGVLLYAWFDEYKKEKEEK